MIDAVANGRLGNTEFFCPFSNGLSFALPGERVIVAFVSCLAFGCAPLTVVRFIVAFVIDAVQRKALRLLSHVCQKVGKVKPLIADPDAFPAIVRIRTMIGVCAPGYHACPRVISRRDDSTSCMTMLGASFNGGISQQATARSRNAPAKGDTRNDFFVTAFATAKPLRLSLGCVFSTLQDGPSFECLTSYVNEFHVYLRYYYKRLWSTQQVEELV